MNEKVNRYVEEDAQEPWHPVMATLLLVQKKWKLAIIYQLLDKNSRRFTDLNSSIRGISSKALSNSLKELEADGIVERTVISERPHRVEYSLSEFGKTLEPMVHEMERWGAEHLPFQETDNIDSVRQDRLE